MKIWACLGQVTPSKIDEICPLAISKKGKRKIQGVPQTRSPQHQCTYQIWRISIDIYPSYCPETKIPTGGRTYDGRTDGQTYGHMDGQRETIIVRHYRVVGYKKRISVT